MHDGFRGRILLTAMLTLAAARAPAAPAVELPPPEKKGGMPLLEALAARQSQRAFAATPLDARTLSTLLWAANGVNREESGMRTAPSAKNWQEILVYVARADGCYLYEAAGHRLTRVSEKDLRAAAGKQDFVRTAPVVLIFVADGKRMSGSPAEEQRFYSAADAGYVSQNVYLFCASRGLSTVVLGWVDREPLARELGLAPDRRVLLTQPVGYPPAEPGAAAPRPGPTPPAAGPGLRDGVYSGSARGYEGPVEVKVIVRGGKLQDVKVVRQNESRPKSALMNLPARILAAGGTEHVDAVTGATVTSRAVLRAVRQALDKAAGE
jgi:uncharacterized protein with FMN-binding domain